MLKALLKILSKLNSAISLLGQMLLYSLLGLWLVLGGCGKKGFRIESGKPAIVSFAGGGKTVRHIPRADAETFKALENAEDARAIYAIDAKRTYIGYWNHAMPIESADPTTFSIITPDGTYTKDKDRVYWYGVELQGADPATFQIIKEPYTVDANRAYAGVIPFVVHSLENFEVLQVRNIYSPIGNKGNRLVAKDRSKSHVSGWSRDGIAYYWGGIELKGADYESLAILNDLHAKDKGAVYFRGKPIRGADAETFITVSPGVISGRDRNHEYEKGKRVARQ